MPELCSRHLHRLLCNCRISPESRCCSGIGRSAVIVYSSSPATPRTHPAIWFSAPCPDSIAGHTRIRSCRNVWRCAHFSFSFRLNRTSLVSFFFINLLLILRIVHTRSGVDSGFVPTNPMLVIFMTYLSCAPRFSSSAGKNGTHTGRTLCVPLGCRKKSITNSPAKS